MWSRFVHLSSRTTTPTRENVYTFDLPDDMSGVEVVEIVTLELSTGKLVVREGAHRLYFSEEDRATFCAELPEGMYADDGLLSAVASAMACASVVRGTPGTRPLNSYCVTTRGSRVAILSDGSVPFSLHTYGGTLGVCELVADNTPRVTCTILASHPHALCVGAPIVLTSRETGDIPAVVTGFVSDFVLTARAMVAVPSGIDDWRVTTPSQQGGVHTLLGCDGPDMRCTETVEVTSFSGPVRVSSDETDIHVTCADVHGCVVEETVGFGQKLARITVVPSERHIVLRCSGETEATGVPVTSLGLFPPRILGRRLLCRGYHVVFLRLWMGMVECLGVDRPASDRGPVFARARFPPHHTGVTFLSSADFGVVGVWSLLPALTRVRRVAVQVVDDDNSSLDAEWTMLLRVAGRSS
jgi:hypothetical protein